MKTRYLITAMLVVSFVVGTVQAGANDSASRARLQKKVQESKQIQEDQQYQNQYRYEKQFYGQDDELMELLKGMLVETDGWKEKVRIRQQDQKKLGEQECDGNADQTRLQKQLRGDSLEEDPEYQEFLKYFTEEPLHTQLQTRIRDQKKTGDEDCEPIQQRDQTRMQKQLKGDPIEDDPEYQEFLKYFAEEPLHTQLQTRIRDQKKTGDEDCEPIQQRDQLRDQKQDQLKDGSCQQEVLKAGSDADKTQLQTRIRDQKKTGDEDCEPIQQRDQTRDQKQDQFKDGSCQEEVLKAGADQEPDQTRNQQQIREQKKDGDCAEEGLLERIMQRFHKRVAAAE